MAESKSEAKAETAKASAKAADLPAAGGSSDPLVHQALGELEIAQRNRDALDVSDDDKKAAEEAIKAAEAKLKELGVSP